MDTNEKYENLRFTKVKDFPEAGNTLAHIDDTALYGLVCPSGIKRIAIVTSRDEQKTKGHLLDYSKRSQDEEETLHYTDTFDYCTKQADSEYFKGWEKVSVEAAFKAIVPETGINLD
jgi:hypothetical protein